MIQFVRQMLPARRTIRESIPVIIMVAVVDSIFIIIGRNYTTRVEARQEVKG